MANITYCVALPFCAGDDRPEAREAVECQSGNAARRIATLIVISISEI